jgi:hypothetical protein
MGMTDEEIAQAVALLTPALGPTRAGWYGEACAVEPGLDGLPHEAILWACRYREFVRGVGGRVAVLMEYLRATDGLSAECAEGAQSPVDNVIALCSAMTEMYAKASAERDATLAQLNDWKGRAEAHKKKWWDYEQEYILPAFEWAEECGIDLRAAVSANPGKNCVRLLHEAVCERLDAALAREARLAGALRGAMQFFRYDQFDSWNDYNDARGAAQAALAEHDAAKESDHA